MGQLGRSILFTSHQTEIDFQASESIKRSTFWLFAFSERFLNKIILIFAKKLIKRKHILIFFSFCFVMKTYCEINEKQTKLTYLTQNKFTFSILS